LGGEIVNNPVGDCVGDQRMIASLCDAFRISVLTTGVRRMYFDGERTVRPS
jgi:hypothetical protein